MIKENNLPFEESNVRDAIDAQSKAIKKYEEYVDRMLLEEVPINEWELLDEYNRNIKETNIKVIKTVEESRRIKGISTKNN